MEEEIPYFSLGRPMPIQEAGEQDEKDYPTLIKLLARFRKEIDGLYKDFNAFDINEKSTDAAQRKMLFQIAAKQEAYSILVALYNELESVVNEISSKNRGQ